MSYHFDLSTFTAGDFAAMVVATQTENIVDMLHLANRFAHVDIYVLPFAEIKAFLEDFAHAIVAMQQQSDPIWRMIQQSLEGEQ